MPSDIFVKDILDKFQPAHLLTDESGQRVVYIVNSPIHGKSILKVGLYYGSDQILERAKRDTKILKEINSKYFPKNYDFQVVDSQRYFILEEYLEGGTLKENLRSYYGEKFAKPLIAEIVKGLSILWEKDIVHRDIKPQNIIISNKIPKIIDLGIARMLKETSLTQTGAESPRTPAYASPEQVENRKKDIDFRSDQFSLGIIFAQLILNGKHPFDREVVGNQNSYTENIMGNIWAREAVAQESSAKTIQIIAKMLGHNPYERYRTPEDLKSSLND